MFQNQGKVVPTQGAEGTLKRESAKPPPHNSPTICKATTGVRVIGKEKPCRLHSLQSVTASPFAADTRGAGKEASFAAQRAVLVITFRVCMGAGGGCSHLLGICLLTKKL